MIVSQADIADALGSEMTAFAAQIAALEEGAFMQAPAGKWTAGQHLEHLLRSTGPVYMATGLPGFVLRLLFGKPNRPGRSFEEVVSRYKEKLLAGGAASGRFVPPPVHWQQKDKMLKHVDRLRLKLQRRVLQLPDNKLDGCLLPHPLLGKITIREMLFFTVYHTVHHLRILQKQEI